MKWKTHEQNLLYGNFAANVSINMNKKIKVKSSEV